ncbi:uncharacterized protein [Triticum aestivum]|uniref:uncharacterized protein isoform X2 n=1 Tax=Triticum aestivum TaxID=4565 RepID=UPI001D021334|nr:uncharacterized protein LOC123178830 isoform X2 [Triticum aestivum]
MAAIRCAAAGIALLRRAAAGGERAALQKIFPSLRPRGIHSLLDRPLGAGALSSPTTSMGPARCVFPSNRYMSTSRLQKGGHSAPTYQEPSAKLLCLLTLTASLMYDAWDSYDGFASRFGEFSTCEFSREQISQFPTAAWSILDKTSDLMLEREPPTST